MNELEFTVSSRPGTFSVMWKSLYLFTLLLFTIEEQWAEEIWEQDLSMDMQIGASMEGYDRVSLRCGAERMIIELETPKSFSGVIYTQGSFYSRQSPCFLNPSRGGNFTLIIPFNQCNTQDVANKYKNILILQHDDELITPGDAAFVLECDFSKPKDITVSVDLNEIDKQTRSRIYLVDADPGRDETKNFGYAESNTNEVIFISNSGLQIHDEL